MKMKKFVDKYLYHINFIILPAIIIFLGITNSFTKEIADILVAIIFVVAIYTTFTFGDRRHK